MIPLQAFCVPSWQKVVNMSPVLLCMSFVHFLFGFVLSGICIAMFYQNIHMFILQDLPFPLQFQLPYLLHFWSWNEPYLHRHSLHLLFELVLEYMKSKSFIRHEKRVIKGQRCQQHWVCGCCALGGSPTTWFLYLSIVHIAEQVASAK